MPAYTHDRVRALRKSFEDNSFTFRALRRNPVLPVLRGLLGLHEVWRAGPERSHVRYRIGIANANVARRWMVNDAGPGDISAS
jgi:hypothetical protein